MYTLNKGNAKEGLGDIAKILGIEYEFLLLNLISIIKSKFAKVNSLENENLARLSIK
jgi:hypothetical protein